tara:strand:+ start:301 stop:672 length:372 start_codon:yes stop_codon:yes gene_type:complete
MPSLATPNLPSSDFQRTFEFYAKLGFVENYRDQGWMILKRDSLILEFFFKADNDPKTSWFSACFRVDDLDALYAGFCEAEISQDNKAIPRMGEIVEEPHGIRLFYLIDADGSLIRCIDNLYDG